MRYGSLSDHFVRIAAKRLAAVEADTRRSNQNEFNGVEALRAVLGAEEFRNRPARFIWHDCYHEISSRLWPSDAGHGRVPGRPMA